MGSTMYNKDTGEYINLPNPDFSIGIDLEE
jgi:hypothetical protein